VADVLAEICAEKQAHVARRKAAQPMQVPVPVYAAGASAPAAAPAAGAPAAHVSAPAVPAGESIKSSMMGIFYRAASPSSPPFVKEGESVKPGQAAVAQKSVYITKRVIERPIELALLPMRPVVVPPQTKPEAKPALTAAEDVANWKELQEDTRLNERTRRLQIHELLASTGLVQPEKVMRPIYKDVLHADLDDPYLGLGKSLFASYPFAKEDATH